MKFLTGYRSLSWKWQRNLNHPYLRPALSNLILEEESNIRGPIISPYGSNSYQPLENIKYAGRSGTELKGLHFVLGLL